MELSNIDNGYRRRVIQQHKGAKLSRQRKCRYVINVITYQYAAHFFPMFLLNQLIPAKKRVGTAAGRRIVSQI